MQKRIYRRRRLFLVFPLLIILLLSGIFYFFSLRNKNYAKAEFLNINPQKADSIISLMSYNQMASALFISQNQIKDSNSSILQISSQILNIDTLYRNQYLFNSIRFFNSFSELPNKKLLNFISDSSIQKNYIDIICKSIISKKFNLIFINPEKRDFDFFKKTIFQILKNLETTKIIKSIPVAEFDISDTACLRKWTVFYDSAFAMGANSFYITNNKQLSIVKHLKHQGILIAQDSIFEDYDSFIKSDVDLILCDSVNYNFYHNILKSLHKRKYNRLISSKLQKTVMATIWCNVTDSLKLNKKIIRRKIKLLNHKLFKNSIVCFKNKNNLLPILDINRNLKIFYLTKKFDKKAFQNTLSNYTTNYKSISLDPTTFEESKLQLKTKKNLIFIIIDTTINNKYYKKIKYLDTINDVIVIYDDKNLTDSLYNLSHLIFSPSNNQLSAQYLSQSIYGGISIKGRAQIDFSDSIKKGSGIIINKIRLGYDIPIMVNLDSSKLVRIDSIVNDAIIKGAFPGCQVFVAKNGTVVWNKAYGYHTYSRRVKVKLNDMFDLASITKIAATTLAAMKLYEQGKLPLDVPIGKYFKDTKIDYTRIKPDTLIKIDTLNINQDSTWKKEIIDKDTIWLDDTMIEVIDTIIFKLTPKDNIFKVTPRQLLMHKSGIQPVMPILKLMLLTPADFKNIRDYYNSNQLDSLAETKMQLRKKYYSNTYIKDSATIKVAEGLYLKNQYFDTLWRDTKELPVSQKVYLYSDVNMIILQMTIDSINRKPLNIYTTKEFYKPLGLKYTSFLPYKYYPKNLIVPTERDKYWRKQLLQGYVHDPSAAIMGGVAGNAGLFSNAHELGIIFQMLLNGGTYGGKRYLSAKTVKMFTQTQADSYRGLGFDKWSKRQIIARSASRNTYGHTGFTGTCVWADPDNQIVFVFLSNRVNPSAKNQKINRLKVRQKVHQAIYDAIITN